MKRSILFPICSKWIFESVRNLTYSQDADEQVFSPFKILKPGELETTKTAQRISTSLCKVPHFERSVICQS